MAKESTKYNLVNINLFIILKRFRKYHLASGAFPYYFFIHLNRFADDLGVMVVSHGSYAR